MKNRKVISNIFIIVGMVCIAAALLLALMNEYDNKKSLQNERAVVVALKEQDEQKEIVSADSIYEDEDIYYLPIEYINGNGYIGFLSFDTFENEFPVMEQWDYDKLKISVCRYSGDLENNLVIAGHNYREGFGKLKTLSEGDRVYFTTVDGRVFEYEVGLKEILEPADIEEMISGPWDMSLYTCTYGGKQRMTIRCKRCE